MLPKISAAISQFIAPLTTTDKQPSRERRAPQDQTKKDGKRGAEIIPFQRQPTVVKAPEPALPAAPQTPAQTSASVAHSFIHLLSSFQLQRETLIKWLGVHNYIAAARARKGAARLAKGSMLDTKAE